MAKIKFVTGSEKAIAQIKEQAAKYSKETVSVLVGYTQNYGVYVHENLQAKHPIGKAKFLEDPARRMAKELGAMIGKSLKKGTPPVTALVLAGLRLQRASQKEVPVDTGALKNSAFTRKE